MIPQDLPSSERLEWVAFKFHHGRDRHSVFRDRIIHAALDAGLNPEALAEIHAAPTLDEALRRVRSLPAI